MKKLIAGLGGLVFASVLAACGGGGSSAVPGAVVTPVPYKVQLHFTGGGMLHTASVREGDRQIVTVRRASDVVFNQPIVMSALPTDAGSELGNSATGDAQGIATVGVSPQPSTTPAVTLATAGINLTESLLAGSTPTFSIAQTYTAPTTGTLTATVAAPVSASQSVSVFVLRRSLVACGNRTVIGKDSALHPADQVGAVNFVSGVATIASDPSTATISFSGPNCAVVGTSSAEAASTLHFRYGAVLKSSATEPFSGLAASSWSNSITSLTYAQLVADVTTETNPPDELLVKQADGTIVEVGFTDLQMLGTDQQVIVNFNYQQAGFSVNGF